jgi:hypothetical protein
MGWTWGAAAETVLQQFPKIATIGVLVERWPGMREAVAAQKLDKPPADESSARKAEQQKGEA